MGGIVDAAAIILSQATQRVEIVSHNLANTSTIGYKRRVGFAESAGVKLSERPDFSVGQLQTTGAPEHLAIAGQGFFAVRAGEEVLYTRQGRFVRDGEGRLTTPDGGVLLAEGGRELIVEPGFEVAPNGVVLVRGEPGQKIALVGFEDLSVLSPAADGFRAPEGAARAIDATVRQGALEAANVATGQEMIVMIEALRRAEAGQRLVNVYDDLLGRATTTFGQP